MSKLEIGQKVTWYDGGSGSSSPSFKIGSIHSFGRVNIKVERLRSGKYSYEPPKYIFKKKQQLKLM